MIEPTESESKSSLENFSSILEKIDDEINEDPALLTNAPFNTPVRRLDETKAVRELRLTWDKVGN